MAWQEDQKLFKVEVANLLKQVQAETADSAALELVVEQLAEAAGEGRQLSVPELIDATCMVGSGGQALVTLAEYLRQLEPFFETVPYEVVEILDNCFADLRLISALKHLLLRG